MRKVIIIGMFMALYQPPTYGFVDILKTGWDMLGKGFDQAMAIKEVILDVNDMKNTLEDLKVIEEGSLKELDELSAEMVKLNEGHEMYKDLPGYTLDQVPYEVWDYKANLELFSTQQSKYTNKDVFYESTVWTQNQIDKLEKLFSDDIQETNISDQTKKSMLGIDENTRAMRHADQNSIRRHHMRLSAEALKIEMQNIELQRKLLIEAKRNKHQEKIKELEDKIEKNRAEMVFNSTAREGEDNKLTNILRTMFR
jgi:hypothetical protein